jgi:translation initiation factor 2B subunit (eIF-2B alpha/beta/delta family)
MNKRSAPKKRFAICITDSEPDLESRKVYQVLPDAAAAKDDYIRVVDESGEDYISGKLFCVY